MAKTVEIKKLELLCCLPGNLYIDDKMIAWRLQHHVVGLVCNRCEKKLGDDNFAYMNGKDHEIVCDLCVRDILPGEMFDHYRKYHSIAHLYSRFGDMMRDSQVEFMMHHEKKRDSWETRDMTDLIIQLIRVFCKFTITENDMQATYDELIDLMLMCLMTGVRYKKELDADGETT